MHPTIVLRFINDIHFFQGGDQLQEAIHIYEELKEKHGPSTLLLNGQAAALMGMNNWVEAEPVLQEAIDLVSLLLIYFSVCKNHL